MSGGPVRRRLIEDWLPTRALSAEAMRERNTASSIPPVNWLHVWWARRPLVVSRAAVAATLLPADADRNAFYDLIGTYPEVADDRERLELANRAGDGRQRGPVYVNPRRPGGGGNHPRAFNHNPSPAERGWFLEQAARAGGGGDGLPPLVLDLTAGGGSIPFEAQRLGLRTIANDLNPVAALILRATCHWPRRYGYRLPVEYRAVARRFRQRVDELMNECGVYPAPPAPPETPARGIRVERRIWAYLWARTAACRVCGREMPLAGSWTLTTDGVGARLLPDEERGVCAFGIATRAEDVAPGTIRRGGAVCPYPSCGEFSDRGYLVGEVKAGRSGQRSYAVVCRERRWARAASGRESKRPVSDTLYLAPGPAESRAAARAGELLAEPAAGRDAPELLPDELIPAGDATDGLLAWGLTSWRELFSDRQLLAHGSCVRALRELAAADRAAGDLNELRQAAWICAALALDKMINRNSLLTRWTPAGQSVNATFDIHDYAMRWSYAELAVGGAHGGGLAWALDDMGECLDRLCRMTAATAEPVVAAAGGGDRQTTLPGLLAALDAAGPPPGPPATVLTEPAQRLSQAPDGSVDAVVFDPPWYDNVHYAELSDFFYVWLKRGVGAVWPDWGRDGLTDKVNEAVAKPSRFRGQAGGGSGYGAELSPAQRAGRDYETRMTAIFRECRRTLKPDGVMTVMFAHRTAAAWQSIVAALGESGFAVVRAWPVRTEPEVSLHIRGKAAAVRSTVLLVCRLRPADAPPSTWRAVAAMLDQAEAEAEAEAP